MTKKLYTTTIGLLFMALMGLFAASCSDQRSKLPEEFKLARPLYQSEDPNPLGLGPGGLNESFTVYKLPQEVSATIADKGLPYLNSLPSPLAEKKKSIPPKVYSYEIKDGKKVPEMTGPWWGPFIEWHATPVSKDARWVRSGRGDDWKDTWKDGKPSIRTFYTISPDDHNEDGFIAKIPTQFSDSFHEAISTPGSFYAYGAYRGICLLVVSPKAGKVFYLFRD